MTSPSVDVVALAASAGGLRALGVVLKSLPADFGAAVVVVQHLDPRRPSHMAGILDANCALPVAEARDGDRLARGQVFVAPPDRHLVVASGGSLSLSADEPVRFVRPSADVLFSSLAEAYGRRAIAVVLSGTGSDGTNGIRRLRAEGGTTIAQDPATSEFTGMPGAAIEAGVDLVLPLEQIGPTICSLVVGA